jgi:hypothetical protein
MDRHHTHARIAAKRLLWALACAASLCLLAAPAGSAFRVKHSCHAPRPGRAACLSMRLLVSSKTAAAPLAKRHSRAGVRANERSKPYPGYLTPELLHDAYQLPNETAGAATQTIAVVDAFDDPTAEADLAVYDKEFGLPACTSENGCFEKVNQKGEAAPLPKVEGGWATEISIDVQMAHAICQNCHVLLVETKSEGFNDLGTGVNAAASLGATEISNSYGGTEEAGDAALASADYKHPGIVVAASSGDCGYLNSACFNDTSGANFPADSPDVLSVGGTSLSRSGGAWTSSAWEEGGSGCSEVFAAAPWQSAVASFSATGCGSGRAIADISAIGDPNTGVDTFDSTPEEPGAPTGWGVWGGTSVAAPIVTAEFALAGGANSVVDPAQTLYAHAGEAADLYDVTTGSNGQCAGATICKAAAGFDGPTGLGSPLGLGAFAVSGAPESTSPPSVSGAPEEGATLTEGHGGWTGSPSEYSYQWERCGFSGSGCHAIAGATEQTYAIPAGSIGYTIRVSETARNASGPNTALSSAVGPVSSNVPAVTGFTPASAITGSTIVVEGASLGSATAVTVAGLNAPFAVLSAGRLEVTVPNGTFKGKISVTTPHGTATSKKKFAASFTIRALKPASAAPGSVVSIQGIGFNSSSQVSFDGTPATVVSASAKKIKAIVPAGAEAGPVTVTNTAAPAGTVTSAAAFTP